MFIVDDIILAPFKGLTWIIQQINHAVEQEQENDAENITQELSQLYMMLETGRITEQEFDEKEEHLLDRLDEIQGLSGSPEADFYDSEDDDDPGQEDPDDEDPDDIEGQEDQWNE